MLQIALKKIVILGLSCLLRFILVKNVEAIFCVFQRPARIVCISLISFDTERFVNAKLKAFFLKFFFFARKCLYFAMDYRLTFMLSQYFKDILLNSFVAIEKFVINLIILLHIIYYFYLFLRSSLYFNGLWS